jgi:hypothetical protein
LEGTKQPLSSIHLLSFIQSVIIKCSKQLSVTPPWGEHSRFLWLPELKHGATSIQDFEHSDCSSTGCTEKKIEKVCKIVNKD